MKKKFNQDLLNEEIKKFKLISEYRFHTVIDEKSLITGMDEEEDLDGQVGDIAQDLGVEPPTGEPEAGTDPNLEPTATAPESTPSIDTTNPVEPEAPVEDTEEIDVTSLVNNTDEAKEAASEASHNSIMLMKKLDDLENRVANMDKVSAKIDDLEREIIKRNPTPVEKLEMRSLSSYPYSQKLTDYWAEKEGPYDVMNNEKEEYVLTKDDVDSGYSENNIKNSFKVKPEDYTEEDI